MMKVLSILLMKKLPILLTRLRETLIVTVDRFRIEADYSAIFHCQCLALPISACALTTAQPEITVFE